MSPGRNGSGPAGRRRLLAVIGAVGLVFVVWLSWCVVVVQTPTLDRAQPVDAVLVLGGLDGSQRTERALGLVREGMSRTLVLSVPVGSTDTLARHLCSDAPAGVRVLCFQPRPSTTRGEAREIGRLAQLHGWTSVAVITSTYHVSRARTIMRRCFAGRLVMIRSHEHISLATWAYQDVYQTLGYAKVLLQDGC